MDTLPKIARFRAMVRESGRDVDIGVDGGIDTSTVGQAVAAGANVLVAGTTIFSAQHSVQAGIEGLRAALNT
jgi:ribulose-phosphate 3-epimerase